MKKKIIIFGNSFFLKKNIVLKNSLNCIFFKKLKNLYKKNIFLNYFFFNKFINIYKTKNINFYLKYFYYNNLNFFFIYNTSIFKKQFIYNFNYIKLFFKKKFNNFLFLTKKTKKNFFFNNCFLISSIKNNLSLDENYLEYFKLIKLNKNIQNFNYFFINYNLFLFSLLEYYKIIIIIYIFNLKLIKKYI